MNQHQTQYRNRRPVFTLFLSALASCSLWSGLAQAQKSGAATASRPFIIAPTIEGMYVCPAAIADIQNVHNLEDANAECREKKQVGSEAVKQLLDSLEPGGAKGNVQVGYTSTLQLLGLYRKTENGWEIDPARVDAFLQLIKEVDRPVVVYFSADHFDTIGPLPQALAQDPRNLMKLRDGKPLELGYFGYKILPYTLRTDPAIPVNKYRYEALNYVAKRIQALPDAIRSRIVAYTLVGELHHMFPDFENGMGAFQNLEVTDYSPESVEDFQKWLKDKYKTVDALQKRTGLQYVNFESIPAPSKDIRTESLKNFGEHYDGFANGILPIGGWLWDPQNAISRIDLYVDGIHAGTVSRYLNRLDVYRSVDEVTTPNTGYRIDYDFTGLRAGKHKAQVVAISAKGKSLLGEVAFAVVPRDQSHVKSGVPAGLKSLPEAQKSVPSIRTWMDMPKSGQDLYFNPLARDWNDYRQSQVYGFLEEFHRRAVKAGLPADKLYSHQIVANVNSSWNTQLFESGSTINGNTPWKQGLNMYGGTTDSPWMHFFVAQKKITDYGVPEFNPQQWKREGVHLSAMESQMKAGARFISPYYFSVVPQRFKGDVEHGVNRMELTPDNPKDGSNLFYRAIVDFARQ